MSVGELRKIEVRHKHVRHWVWYVTAISFITGALLAASLRTQKAVIEALGGTGTSFRVNDLAERLRTARAEVEDQRVEMKVRLDRITELEKALAERTEAGEVLNKDLQKYKVLTGLAELDGPGVVITLNDSTFRAATTNPEEIEGLMLHDYDLQRVVNELRAAGAEAVSVNGQRLVERSAIRCVGPVTHVNNVPIGTPYVVKAIGDPAVLTSGMTIPGGVMEGLKSLGFPVAVKEESKLRVPAFTGPVALRHARAVPVEQETEGPRKEGGR
ncbi:MAG: DUF881 domain-containing protein [Armatimonadetes bacterium]|nr:DUF881 domain-containing protein [Armatimonadota bacterium]